MEDIILRALEPNDLDFLYDLENHQALWHLSCTQLPFSKAVLKNYIKSATQDIYSAKQYRYIISNKQTNSALGCIDLFDFNPMHRRAGVGIVLLEAFQGQGLGKKALSLLEDQAFGFLQLHQLYANIGSNNEKSLSLFRQSGYTTVGIKKEWNYSNNSYHDEVMVQKIKHV